jgi:acyl-CoA reductase-like NAD-dependent aldehyde dehydrogenase
VQTVDLLIGGLATPATGNATYKRCNPASAEPVTQAAAATVADASRAADAARSAFPAWAALGPSARRAKLNAAAQVMEKRSDDFVRAMMDETGATAMWSGFNVHLAANMLREAAALTTQISGHTLPTDTPDNLAMAVREPCGVILGIAPWNAPVILGTRAVATALACGNTVILKASEQCPETHHLIGQVLIEAGLDQGVVNVVTNAPADAPAVVSALIEHPAVRRINFTGSTKVGRIIAETAARQLKPVLLELGGKAPMIVLDDADLDAAVEAAAFGAFFHQGQICMSTERLIVLESVADAFVEKLIAKTRTLRSGDPRQGGDTPLGTLIGDEARHKLNDLLADAESHGARISCGGPADSVIMQPTVVDGVTSAMRLYSEESFGPLVSVIRAGDEAEAIQVANDSEYGLSAAVFSGDGARGLRVAKHVRSGICHVNGPTVHDEPQMPFGGVGDSGYGRFGGQAGIAEFTELRWITLQTGPRHYPI